MTSARARSAIRRVALTAVCLFPLVAAACTTHSERVAAFRGAYGQARFAQAEAAVDALIADEAGVATALVSSSNGLATEIDSSRGETFLFQLEKSMTRLADGDTGSSINLLRRGRNVLDTRYTNDAGEFFKAALLDDTSVDYRGADYEHIVVRTLLALVDLLEGGNDAYSYALQIGEKQEEMLGSTFGVEGEGIRYRPREQYRRVAIGAYLQGVVQEGQLERDAAAASYQRALDYQGGTSRLLRDAVERVTRGTYAAPGSGAVHVFYLAGRGPYLREVRDIPTSLATSIAGLGIAIIGNKVSALIQVPVPVPQVVLADRSPAPLVAGAGGTTCRTETLLDVNRVASEQAQANAPMVLARAIIRRAIKAAAAAVTESVVSKAHGGRRETGDVLGFAAGAILNLVSTGLENADTRHWSALPAEIQAARIELPAGVHSLSLSDGGSVGVRVLPGRDSYVIIVRPNLGQPGVALVDRFSRSANE